MNPNSIYNVVEQSYAQYIEQETCRDSLLRGIIATALLDTTLPESYRRSGRDYKYDLNKEDRDSAIDFINSSMFDSACRVCKMDSSFLRGAVEEGDRETLKRIHFAIMFAKENEPEE